MFEEATQRDCTVACYCSNDIMMIFDILIWAPDIEVLTEIYVSGRTGNGQKLTNFYYIKDQFTTNLKHFQLQKQLLRHSCLSVL